MQPLVQSAIDAANHGDNNKALELCKQALAANPDDVDAWLVVAAVVEQPERKRLCLNRVLTLDPANQIARDELLDMDRAALGGTPPSDPEPDPASEPMYQPAPPAPDDPGSTSAFESAPASEQSVPVTPETPAKAAPKPATRMRTGKPLVFKYPLFWRVFVYFFSIFLSLIGLMILIALQDIAGGLTIFGIALLVGIGAFLLFPKVEITGAGIRVSTALMSSESNWRDIKSIKSNAMKRRLELFKSNGQVVKVSTQVNGYPRIVEILRQKRPDLFGTATPGQGNTASEDE